MTMRSRICFLGLLLVAGLIARPAAAAESYDNCTGFIDSLPATISTQGVWCLRHNLGTSITSGAAITIATNNVTIDCNDFKLGGLAAGNDSGAFGIRADNRQNATVRHCNVRGFNQGIYLFGGAGHLVEDNRLDNNLYAGIGVSGDTNLVQRNQVYDTGGRTGAFFSYGIVAQANIVDNTISGLFHDTSGGNLYGIYSSASGVQIRGNQVSGFDMTAVQGGDVFAAYGIYLLGDHQRVSGNQVSADGPVSGTGISSFNASYCLDNSVGGFNTNFDSDCTGSGNVSLP